MTLTSATCVGLGCSEDLPVCHQCRRMAPDVAQRNLPGTWSHLCVDCWLAVDAPSAEVLQERLGTDAGAWADALLSYFTLEPRPGFGGGGQPSAAAWFHRAIAAGRAAGAPEGP